MEAMISETAKPRSCFLHVPKSGGTALTLYLRGILGRRNVFHIGEGRYRRAPLEGLMKRYHVITGHFNVGQIPEQLFQTTFFFTFLREPVDRVVSMYHFFKEGDLDSNRRAVINEEWDLEHALDKWAQPGRCSSWSNEQTFLFSGATDADRSPEDLLPLAMRNLERFDFVGIHERFAEGVECLGRLRDWPLQAPVPRFKTSRKRLALQDMEPALVERIRAANRCDVQLFDRARELWEEAKAQADRLPVTARLAPAREGLEARVPLEAASVVFPTQLTTATLDATVRDSPIGTLLPRVERGTREISFNGVDVFDLRTAGDAVIQRGNPAEIRLAVYSTIDAEDVHVGVRLCDEADAEVYGVNTRMRGRALSLEAGTITTVTFAFEMSLAAGAYFLSVAVQGGDTHDEKLFHWVDNAMLVWCVDERAPAFTGVTDLHARIRVAKPVFVEERQWHPPRVVRRALQAGREKVAQWRPPKLLRYIIRTLKNERWNAIRIFLSGKPPPKAGEITT